MLALVEVRRQAVESDDGGATKLAVVTRQSQPREEVAQDTGRLDEVVHRQDREPVDGTGGMMLQPLVDAAAAEAVLARANLDRVAQHLCRGERGRDGSVVRVGFVD